MTKGKLLFDGRTWGVLAIVLFFVSACQSDTKATPTLSPPAMSPPPVLPSPTIPLPTDTPETAVLPAQLPLTEPPTAIVTAVPTACIARQPLGWISYTIQRGDNLFRLSLRGGVTIEQIQQANCRETDIIYVGERLFVPPGSVATSYNNPPLVEIAPAAEVGEQPAPPPCGTPSGSPCAELEPTDMPGLEPTEMSVLEPTDAPVLEPTDAPVIVTVVVTVVVTATPQP